MKRKIQANRLLRVTLLEHAEVQARYLVGFLNTASDRPEYAEVLSIFEQCAGLTNLRKAAPPLPVPTPPNPSIEIREYEHKKTLALREVNEALSGFQFLPLLADGRDAYRLDWKPAHVEFPAPTEVKRIMMAGATPILPLGAVKLVLDMTETGTLDRIRKCICGLWFFAGNNKKYSCSDACKFTKHQQGATFKPGRAKYMKKWRKDRKDQKLREKRAKARQAGRKTP